MDPVIQEALICLELTGYISHPPKMKIIIKQYHKLSLKHHPDRPGGDTATYQTINNAYHVLGEFIDKYYDEPKGDDYEEQVARSAFKQFIFSDIKENLNSFTIKVDNRLSFTWDKVLSSHYGNPADRKGNGKHWKHCNYSDDDHNTGVITIGKWHIPKKDKQSKLHIQSNGVGNFLAAHFVSFHLPKLLSEVIDATKDTSKIQNVAAKPLPSKESALNCKSCDYKSVSLSLLNTHIKSKHRALKNQSPTPLKILPSKPVMQEPVQFQCFV